MSEEPSSAAPGPALAELRMETFRYFLEEQRQLWQSGRDWAEVTVRLLLAGNGGAIIAVLGLMGALAKTGGFPSFGPALISTTKIFAWGVAFATLAAAFGTIYFALLWRALPSTDLLEAEMVRLSGGDEGDEHPFSRDMLKRELAFAFYVLSLLAAVASLSMLMTGAYAAANAFSQPPQTARFEARAPAPLRTSGTGLTGRCSPNAAPALRTALPSSTSRRCAALSNERCGARSRRPRHGGAWTTSTKRLTACAGWDRIGGHTPARPRCSCARSAGGPPIPCSPPFRP